MAGERFNDYDVEDGLDSPDEHRDINNVRTSQHHETSGRPSEAILQAAADRIAQESKTSNGPSRPRPPKFGASTYMSLT